MNYCPNCGENLKSTKTESVELAPFPSPYSIPTTGGSGCLWDSMPETFPGSGIKIAGLFCPCPIHAMWC